MYSFIRDIFVFLINLQFMKMFANKHVCKPNKISICCIFLEYHGYADGLKKQSYLIISGIRTYWLRRHSFLSRCYLIIFSKCYTHT